MAAGRQVPHRLAVQSAHRLVTVSPKLPMPEAPQPDQPDLAVPPSAPQPIRDRRRSAEPGQALAALNELFRAGGLSEAAMLDGAARILDLDQVALTLMPPDPALAGLIAPELCLRHAFLPWRRVGSTLICATAEPETARNLAAILPADIGPARAVLAPRAEVLGAVTTRHRAHLIRRMAARPRPEDSFRSYRPSLRLRLAALAILGLAGFAVALVPGAVFSTLVAAAFFTLAALVTLRSAAALAQLIGSGRQAPPQVEPVSPPSDLPTISIIVPLYHEPCIASRLVQRLQRLDYPRDRLEVLLALEETDDLTARALGAAELPNWMQVVTVPDGAPRTKPRAMNYTLDFCRGEVIGIYDAEDAPDRDQLLRVAARFAAAPPEVACLQGALDYYNPRQNWIARCFTIEYNTWFRLLLPGMARLGLAVPLGGTTLFLRRAALEQVGGWDAHNVTEDADLGFRLARYGHRTEVIDTTTNEEANCRPVGWIRQRSRWIKGYIVTYLVQMRRPVGLYRALGAWRFLGFQLHFTVAVAQFLLGPVLWTFWLVAVGLPHPMTNYVSNTVIWPVFNLCLLAEGLNMVLAVLGTRRAIHRHLWPYVPTMILYFPLASLAAYKALFELLVVPFYWDKTPHGHSLPPDAVGPDNESRPESRTSPDTRYATGATPPESSLSRVMNAFDI